MKCYHVYDSRSGEFCFDIYADNAEQSDFGQVVFYRNGHVYCVVSFSYYKEEKIFD